MGFFHHITKAIKHNPISHALHETVEAVEHNPVTHAIMKDVVKPVINTVEHNPISHAISEGWHHVERPLNKAIAKGIKAVTGHNVLGSHPLTAIGTVVAGIATAGAASALIGGASLGGAASAGLSALESTAGSMVGGVGSGLSSLGMSSAGATVSGWGSALDAAAASSMAASGSIAGQMGLSGMQATEMNLGSGLTKAGQAMGNNIVGHTVAHAGDALTSSVSNELAAGTGHAMGSFGFATAKDGSTQFVNGTLEEVAKVTDNYGGKGVFANSFSNLVKQAAAKTAGQAVANSVSKPSQGGSQSTGESSSGNMGSITNLLGGGSAPSLSMATSKGATLPEMQSFGSIGDDSNLSIDAFKGGVVTPEMLGGNTNNNIQLTAF